MQILYFGGWNYFQNCRKQLRQQLELTLVLYVLVLRVRLCKYMKSQNVLKVMMIKGTYMILTHGAMRCVFLLLLFFWSFAFSPSAKCSVCQKPQMLNSRRNLVQAGKVESGQRERVIKSTIDVESRLLTALKNWARTQISVKGISKWVHRFFRFNC